MNYSIRDKCVFCNNNNFKEIESNRYLYSYNLNF